VTAAVTQHGHALKYSSDKMKGNFCLVLIALRQRSRAVQHVSQDFVIAASFLYD